MRKRHFHSRLRCVFAMSFLLIAAGCKPSAVETSRSIPRSSDGVSEHRSTRNDCMPKHGKGLRPAEKEPDDRYSQHRRDILPVLGPPEPGKSDDGLDPPSRDDVIREFLKRGLDAPSKYTLTLIADFVDPPIEIPLVGRCIWHHIHYKCTADDATVGSPGTSNNGTAKNTVHLHLDHLHILDIPDIPSPRPASDSSNDSSRPQPMPRGTPQT
jgi:hypothetical protein